MERKELTEAGVFAGVGGFQLAAEMEGIKTQWVCEIDNYRQNILKQHFPHATIYGNIFKVKQPAKTDILTGGFPCPDISISGPGAGLIGWRSRLWYEYFRIICESRPRYIVIENSPQLANKGLEIILYDLAKAGYNAEWQSIPATAFGYPIIRERTFVIAFTMQSGQTQHDGFFKSIQEVFHKEELPGQINLPVPLKRIDTGTDFNGLRIRPGFSKGLDTNRIEAIGDAVNVTVARYVLRCIKIYDEQISNY